MPHEYTYDELIFTVGKNAQDNWNLVENADPTDIWIHLHDHPSAHVIIENTKDIEFKHIEYGCSLCKEHSKFKNGRKMKFSVSSIKDIKKGKAVGEVKFLKPPVIYTI